MSSPVACRVHCPLLAKPAGLAPTVHATDRAAATGPRRRSAAYVYQIFCVCSAGRAGLAPTVHVIDSSGWAQETQRCALLIKRHALSPFAAPAGLAPTVQCCCLALAHCAALRASHALALGPTLLRELWPACDQARKLILRLRMLLLTAHSQSVVFQTWCCIICTAIDHAQSGTGTYASEHASPSP